MKAKKHLEATFVFVIFLVALSLRINYHHDLSGSVFLNTYHSNSDSYNFLSAANNIINNNTDNYYINYTGSKFYVYIISFLLNVHNSISTIQLFQSVASSLSIFFIFYSLKLLHSSLAGFIASLLFSFYSMSVLFSGLVIYTTLFSFFIFIFIFSTSLFIKSNSHKHFIYMFLSLILVALFRRNYWILVFSAPIILFYKHKQNLLNNIILTIICLITAFSSFSIMRPNFSLKHNFDIHFYIGNNESSSGLYDKINNIRPNSKGHLVDGILLANNPLTNKNNYKHYYLRKSLDYIISNPLSYAKLLLKKLLFMINKFEPGNNTSIYYQKQYCKTLRMSFVGFALIFPFACSGILISIKRHKKFHLLYLLFSFQIISNLIIFIADRYRFQLVPLLIIFAALSMAELIKFIYLKQWKLISYHSIILCFAFTLTSLNFPELSERKSIKYHENQKKEIAKEVENKKELLALIKKQKTFSAKKLILLAKHLKHANLLYEAEGALLKALNKTTNNDEKAIIYSDMANIKEDMVKFSEALIYWQKLKEIKPDSKIADIRIITLNRILNH